MAVIPSSEIGLKAAADYLKKNQSGAAAESAKAQNTAAAQRALNDMVSSTGRAETAANGISAGGSNAMTQQSNPQSSVMSKQPIPTMDGLSGVRGAANNAGIQNIGWNDSTKSVTFDGVDYVKPSKVSDDGTAYADNQTIHSAINDYYRNSGTPLVGARNYADGQGFSNAATWSDGQLLIGGQQVPVAYVDDNGTAYAKQADVDKALASYKQSAGIKGNQGVYDNWDNKYGDRINQALSDILNREQWSYDTESDPAYKAYRDAYVREGNRAYQNAYAQMAANTGGYGSSAGMTAAGQQMNYYMQQLGDRVPELMRDSYNRYLGEQELRRAALSSLMGVANDDYSKEYQANRDSISDSNAANYYSYLRDTAARDYNRQAETEDRQWKYQEALLAEQVKQSRLSTLLNKYQFSGNIDAPISAEDAQAAGIPAKADGTYPSIREIQNYYAALQAEANRILWEQQGRQEAIDTYNISKGLFGGNI